MIKNILLTFLVGNGMLYAQSGQIKGYVYANESPLVNTRVEISNLNIETKTDSIGYFNFQQLPKAEVQLVISHPGYSTYTQSFTVGDQEVAELNVELSEDYLELEGIVITANRKEVPIYKAPVIVSRINNKTFETTQSLSLSESLNYAPGLRMENNCQNCGFNQVRMNGLEGPYSQILVNSRPIFSPLMGIYGLDMLPTSMIDRVEVVRGGGSALYGGSAIAGTINIITKEPIKNSFSIGTNLAFTNYKTPDRTINVTGSLVSDDLNKGISFYAYNRERKPWDANDDGFSEQTLLKNTTFGFDSFWDISDRSKLKLNAFNINEFRRGGNKFDLPAHQTDVTEQLDHKLLGGSISFETFSNDYSQKFSVFASAQNGERNSYYGGGGRILTEEDQLTPEDITAINAYGKSNDISMIAGTQYANEFNEKYTLTTGIEYQVNKVDDQMPGYNRAIDQKVGVLGAYGQMEWKPIEKLTLLGGARFDHVSINGVYDFNNEIYRDNKNISKFIPRVSAMYSINDYLKARASYSQGYRAPQAFDEDLHVETVGGAASFTILSDDLKTETSNSYTASLNFTKTDGKFQTNIVLEGFSTQLNDVFITADATELPNGVSVLTKRNGNSAKVMGLNLETSFAFSKKFSFQFGGTFQSAKYSDDEVIWSSDEETITTKNLLRTPDVYGYYTLNYVPISNLNVSLSGVYTGSMYVPHVVDVESEKTVIKKTKDFFEQNMKVSYDLDIKDNCIQIYSGIHNIFNAFQKDFDRGAFRDAGYIYGPSRPQTFFIGATYKLN